MRRSNRLDLWAKRSQGPNAKNPWFYFKGKPWFARVQLANMSMNVRFGGTGWKRDLESNMVGEVLQ